jgi:cytochrome c peroxidase
MSCGNSSKSTRYVTRAGILALLVTGTVATGAPFEDIVREAARKNGFVPAAQTHAPVDPALVAAGQVLFKSKALSLNGNIACQTCHLDEFGSADGIPNAVAVGGKGKGRARALGDGGILPRNTLPFWGRGGTGFSVFFWDGKVHFGGENRASQFGDTPPSDDPFITAVHLPPVEIREMLAEDRTVLSNKNETIRGAENLYAAIMSQLRRREPAAIAALAKAYAVREDELSFLHAATSLASFIRDRFRILDTRFHRFVFAGEALSAEELRGAQLFYGKGKCAGCHSGPYLSDFRFHAIAFPQIGVGKNGFGVDYGRFNITHDPRDLYKFRTPPLFNVEKTAPYGHSGSVASMGEAVIVHFDPLRGVNLSDMTALDRHEFFKRLAASADTTILAGYLDDKEVEAIVSFLKTLTFQPVNPLGSLHQ